MRLVRACLLVVLWLLACGDDGSDRDRGTASQIWCRGLCEAERRCRTATPASICEQTCVERRPGLSNFSQDGARALRPCLEALSCAAFMVEEASNAGLDACWEDAQARVDVSSRARSFCTAYVEAWFECGDYWSVAECERLYSLWSDAVIARFEPCVTAATCDGLGACAEATWSSL
jgi:hypothetical protein